MKKTLIVVALLVAFAPMCHAQDADSGSTERAVPVSFMSDSNAPEEFAGDETTAQIKHPFKRRPMALEKVKEFDADSDGVLSDAEKTAMESERPRKGPPKGDGKVPAELLAKYDTDGDGVLSDTERTAMDTAMKAEMLAKFDTDNDGSLSDTEKSAMHEARKAEMQAKMLTKFDADGDGTLSDTEKAAIKQTRPERSGKGGFKGKHKGLKNMNTGNKSSESSETSGSLDSD